MDRVNKLLTYTDFMSANKLKLNTELLTDLLASRLVVRQWSREHGWCAIPVNPCNSFHVDELVLSDLE